MYYHWMPGLPGSTPDHDLELSRQLFGDERFRPDGLKLYPTLVVRRSELENWYRNNCYQPYGDDEMIELLMAIKALVPKYVRISRLMRDIPGKFIIAGSRDYKQSSVGCRCLSGTKGVPSARKTWFL